jgi:hypothetical protein
VYICLRINPSSGIGLSEAAHYTCTIHRETNMSSPQTVTEWRNWVVCFYTIVLNCIIRCWEGDVSYVSIIVTNWLELELAAGQEIRRGLVQPAWIKANGDNAGARRTSRDYTIIDFLWVYVVMYQPYVYHSGAVFFKYILWCLQSRILWTITN